jgi:hypothetical protein
MWLQVSGKYLLITFLQRLICQSNLSKNAIHFQLSTPPREIPKNGNRLRNLKSKIHASKPLRTIAKTSLG